MSIAIQDLFKEIGYAASKGHSLQAGGRSRKADAAKSLFSD
jgi:hypothetical protein